jgi:hypothetical protein
MKAIGLSRLFITVSLHAEPDATEKAIRIVIDEYEANVRANTIKIIEAKTEEEKNKDRDSVPSAETYAAKVLKLVQENMDAPGSAIGANWLATQATNFPEGLIALQMLGTSHNASAGIAQATRCQSVSWAMQPIPKVPHGPRKRSPLLVPSTIAGGSRMAPLSPTALARQKAARPHYKSCSTTSMAPSRAGRH